MLPRASHVAPSRNPANSVVALAAVLGSTGAETPARQTWIIHGSMACMPANVRWRQFWLCESVDFGRGAHALSQHLEIGCMWDGRVGGWGAGRALPPETDDRCAIFPLPIPRCTHLASQRSAWDHLRFGDASRFAAERAPFSATALRIATTASAVRIRKTMTRATISPVESSSPPPPSPPTLAGVGSLVPLLAPAGGVGPAGH